jgi:hypothetical protein
LSVVPWRFLRPSGSADSGRLKHQISIIKSQMRNFKSVRFLPLASNGSVGGACAQSAERRDWRNRRIHNESGLMVVSFRARPAQPEKLTQPQLGFALALGVSSPAPARAGKHRT